MLFDLSSPGRKNVVRVIFGFLALLFAVGFVGFGVGGELGGGGIIDGITGNNSGSTSDALEQQIEDAQDDIDAAPGDPEPLAAMALLRVQSGDQQLNVDEATGVPTGLSENSRTEYEEAISVWQQYLDADPRNIDIASATAIVKAYRYLEDVKGAIGAQEVLTESKPNGVNYATLANLYYLDLDLKQGDEARDKAIAESNEAAAKNYEKQFADIRSQVVKAKKEQDKQSGSATGGGEGLTDPFGGLSPTDPGAVPAP